MNRHKRAERTTAQPAVAPPKRGGLVQRAAVNPLPTSEVPQSVHEALNTSGRPLDPATRAAMEPRFGHDFSGVRVHTDSRAAESARAIGARAYTVGPEVVFGEGQFAPGSPDGQKLLAHELTHVVQQGNGSADLQPMSLEPAGSTAEREADSVASAVSSGRPTPKVAVQPDGVKVSRSLFGDIAGGVLGAIGGAALGFLVGGPVGALVGGLLGGVAGAVAGDAVSADKRQLTGREQTEARLVFGNSLDLSAVKICEAPLMGIGANARTPFDTIYFPPGTFSLPFEDFMPWLIHELTHAWQYQHGISVLEKLFVALHGASAYDYGGEEGLRRAAATGKRFTDFNTEQQGDILRDYYRKRKAGQDTSAYDPFVNQVKGILAAPPMGDFPTTTSSSTSATV
ncbi:MAG: eCIS core domain-containing protein [Chloroflexia bacterium]